MSDVFISYQHEERGAVDRIAEVLVDRGLGVWFDSQIGIGEEWSARILKQVREARAVVVCWSERACTSEWVLQEAEIARARGVIAPVFLKPCMPPSPFDRYQAANLVSWDGRIDQPDFLALLTTLESLVGDSRLSRRARLRGGGQRAELVTILRSVLVGLARRRGTPLSYVEAEEALRASAADARVELNEFDQNSLWGALDEIAEQNRRRREPPLAVLVVSRETGMPGRGYWQKHVFLTGDEADLMSQVFQRHLDRVRSYAWPQDP